MALGHKLGEPRKDLKDMKPSEVGGCKPCQDKLRTVSRKRSESMRDKQNLVLVTTFASFYDSYSLCSVVADQIRAGIHAGFHVQLWVLDLFDMDSLPNDLWLIPDLTVRAIMPAFAWKEDTVNEEHYPKVESVLKRHLDQLEDAVVITHDLLFQSWFVTFAKAFHHYNGSNPDVIIYHTTHSTVGGTPDLESDAKWRCTLPKGQKLLCLNFSSVEHTRQFYGAAVEDVEWLQNIRDLGCCFDMDDLSKKIIHKAGMLTATVAQVYPYCATRAMAKGIPHLIRLMGSLKKFEEDPCLVLVDAHATDERARAQRKILDRLIEEHEVEDNVLFVSDVLPTEKEKYTGVSHKVVMDLLLASNLFAFPSTTEMSPLVWMEAALAGCLLVGNSDVPSMADIVPVGDTLYFSFGTSSDLATDVDYNHVAEGILDALAQCRNNTTKRLVLHQHSLHNLSEALRLLGG